jgi:hypothetical protein
MTSLRRAFLLFIAPSKEMADLASRPSIWFPVLITVAGAVIVQLWYFQIVDFAWATDYAVSANRNMARLPEDQRAQLAAKMSKSSLLAIGLTLAVLEPLLLRTLTATFFNLLGKLLNIRKTFRDWLAVVWWAALPLWTLSVLASMLLLAFTRSRQINPTELTVLSMNELFAHRAIHESGFYLLTTLTVLHPLAWWYLVRGTQALSGRSLAFSAGFTLVPILLFYGVWALTPLA